VAFRISELQDDGRLVPRHRRKDKDWAQCARLRAAMKCPVRKRLISQNARNASTRVRQTEARRQRRTN
jgi:hypothetical protein